MEFILACSLLVNFIFAYPEVKKYYLEYKNKKNNALIYNNEPRN